MLVAVANIRKCLWATERLASQTIQRLGWFGHRHTAGQARGDAVNEISIVTRLVQSESGIYVHRTVLAQSPGLSAALQNVRV